MPLTKTRYLQLLRSDGDALADAAAGNWHARVPSCPEWNVADLVAHTGRVHRHKTAIVRHGSAEYPPGLEAERAPDDENELLGWYRSGLEDLVETLKAADPETTAWSWAGDHRVAFWNRRMAQETAVHRWDAENAVGGRTIIDAELAADGIDEMLVVFIPCEGVTYEGPRGSICIQCTDRPAAWTLLVNPGEVPSCRSGASDSDVTAKGAAHDLLLLVWRRISPDDVEVVGDGELLRGLWDYLAAPGQ